MCCVSIGLLLGQYETTAVVAIRRFPCLHQAARRFATNLERKTEQETKPKNQKRIV